MMTAERDVSERAGVPLQRVAARAGRTRTVLVVDDDEAVRESIALVLELEGYRVRVARHGLDALAMLHRESRPDVIVLDLEMPIMPGWDFRAAQLRDPTLAAIPVVVVSSSTHEVSADRRLGKPFDVDELVSAVLSLAGPQ
jgi:CheY-like chemotaxis protein